MENKTYTKDKYIQLNDGTKIPKIGYGSFKVNSANTSDLIYNVLQCGYIHIDTAQIYGNEKDIGIALKKAFETGIIKRENLYITTKVMNKGKHDPEKYLRESLADLNLDYVDLYLIHWPVGAYNKETNEYKQVPLHITWKLMEECVRKGLCKSIGISNFNTQLILDLLSYAEIKPVCLQIELHPYLTQTHLVKFCQKNNITVTAYSPLFANGISLMADIKKSLMKDPVILDLARKYNKTPAQIALNWGLSRNCVVIPKTSTIERLKENLECDTFEMEEEDLKKINNLDNNTRLFDPREFDLFNKIPVFDQVIKI